MLHNVRDELLTLLYRLPPIAYRTLFKIRCADPDINDYADLDQVFADTDVNFGITLVKSPQLCC